MADHGGPIANLLHALYAGVTRGKIIELELYPKACRDLAEEIGSMQSEIRRLRIAHLRRMLSSLPGAVDRMRWFSAHTEAEYEHKKWRRRDQFTRFSKAIKAEIARLRGEG